MYYRICEYCGAALDPSERCDCEEQKQEKEKQTASRASFTPFVINTPSKQRGY